MSLRNVPSKEEVMGWNPQSLADYMRKLKLSTCDTVVLKSNITGTRFMKMTQSELQVFPDFHVPTLTSIQRKIKSGVQSNDFGLKPKTPEHFAAACAKKEEAWESDDSDNGNVYESFDKDDKAEDCICSLPELQTAKKQHGAKTCKANYTQDNYTQDNYAHPMKPPKPERNAAVQDCRKALYSDLKMTNIKKPELPSTSLIPTTKSKGSIVLPPRLSSISLPQPHATSNRIKRLPPVPLIATKPVQEKKSIPEPKQMITQSSDMLMGRHNLHVDMDPSWYGGQVTRCVAEMALREMNKDGAFLVRDSSRSSADHIYTLMVLNKGKVYNIKIRNQGNSYLLGNGLRRMQSFPGVREMINHHTYNPLLLIDGKDQSSREHPQCHLKHPVGL